MFSRNMYKCYVKNSEMPVLLLRTGKELRDSNNKHVPLEKHNPNSWKLSVLEILFTS